MSLYHIKSYNGITISICLALSNPALFISLLQLINREQFLNIAPLFLSSAYLAAASSAAPVSVIFPLTSMYASL